MAANNKYKLLRNSKAVVVSRVAAVDNNAVMEAATKAVAGQSKEVAVAIKVVVKTEEVEVVAIKEAAKIEVAVVDTKVVEAAKIEVAVVEIRVVEVKAEAIESNTDCQSVLPRIQLDRLCFVENGLLV